MYFYKLDGRQMLDLRGNLILSHNNAIVKSRVTSAAPHAVRNAKYIIDIPRLKFVRKIRATFAAIAFIWGKSAELIPDESFPTPVRKNYDH